MADWNAFECFKYFSGFDYTGILEYSQVYYTACCIKYNNIEYVIKRVEYIWYISVFITQYIRLYIKLYEYIGLATKWLRILPLGGIDKIRSHLVVNPVQLECNYIRMFKYIILYWNVSN